MELLVFVLPLLLGPFVLVYGLGQLAVARLRADAYEPIPVARVRTRTPERDEKSLSSRARRNIFTGTALCVGLGAVCLAIFEVIR